MNPSPLLKHPEFSVEDPPDEVTLNSLTDNPVQGDERNFFQVKELGQADSAYSDEIVLVPDREYEGYVYFHNDASERSADGDAVDAHLLVQADRGVLGSSSMYADVFAQGAYATDDVRISTWPQTPVHINFVSGSAVLHTNGKANGAVLDSNDLFEGGSLADGTLIGCDAIDGRLESGERCSGYVSFQFTTSEPPFTVSTTSGPPPGNSVRVRPGDEISVWTEYENTGTTPQDDLEFELQANSGLQIVREGTWLFRGSLLSCWMGCDVPVRIYRDSDDLTDLRAFPDNPEPLGPGQVLRLDYTVKVSDEGPYQCGNRWLAINSSVTIGADTVPSRLIVDVDSVC